MLGAEVVKRARPSLLLTVKLIFIDAPSESRTVISDLPEATPPMVNR